MKKITFLFVALFATMTMMAQVTGTFSGSIPAGWTYITNNPTYPDAAFYATPAGLKLNFEGQGFLSPTLVSSDEVVVTLTIGALNQNTKTAASTDVFTITGLNAADEVVATKTLTSVAVGANNTVTLNGTAIVKVKVIMTGYPNDGTKYCNINLTSCTVGGGGTVDPEPTTDFEMVEAEFVYFADYSSTDGQNFMVNLYSDMTWEENAETGGYVPTSEGNYFSLDVYTASASSFVGTYTFDANDTYMAGTFGSEYSAWVNVSAAGVETALTLTAGTITITSNGAGLGYTVVYSLTDQNSTVHTGTYSLGADVIGIYDQDGNDYSASISDGTAICNVEASLEVYTRNGNIVVPAEAGQRIEVYNMMGQTIYSGVAQNAETTISGLAAQQVLVVRAGNKTAKVIL